MSKYSFKSKIFFIFSIPVIAILYFSYLSINSEYTKLQKAHIIKESSNITKLLSKLMTNIQLERGLGSGYIIAKDKISYKTILLKQFKKTDIERKKLQDIILHCKNTKKDLHKIIGKKAKPIIQNIISDLNSIDKIRKNVLNSTISFKDEIKYYSQINKKILLAIKIFNTINNDYNIDNIAILKIQYIKELSGLERAYIYHQLIGGIKEDLQYYLTVLGIKKENTIHQLLSNSSKESIKIYKNYFSNKLSKNIKICKDSLTDASFNEKDASRCFDISTKYIATLDKTYKVIFTKYLDDTKAIETSAQENLYFIVILWISSLIALFILIYTLRKTLIKEEENIYKLRILSYTFDSQEAMIITDANSIIIEVNNAFTEITGYTQQEAIGQKTSILKSGQHDKIFFEKLWSAIINQGRWHGEIFNKRKNGEIYAERLSITAIKDENNNIVNYIAQFLDISDIKQAQEEAEFQASHDFLTGLLNRRYLLKRLQEEFHKAVRHNFVHAFLFIDLDHFKAVNDKHGHNIGDLLLIEVTSRLKKVLREGDVLARISGDEFGIMALNLEKNSELQAVETICNKILELISTEFILDGHKINISSSIGVKIFPNNEKNIQDIITHADTAMYLAKHDGKNKYVLYKH